MITDHSGTAPDLRKGRRKKSQTDARAICTADRVIPHSIEAEQGVLGCIFLSANESIDECVEAFRAGAQVFYDLRHQTIYELLEAKEAIDVITVQQRLKDRSQLESVGGVSYLASLPDCVPSAANLSFYINIVREKFVLRKLVTTCTEAVSRVYEHEGEVDSLLDEVEQEIFSVRQERESVADSDIRTLIRAAVDDIEAAQASAGRLRGIATGFPKLDRNFRGMKPGQLIVIAGRPGEGKTSLAMNIAEHVAVDGKIPVGVFSLEMTRGELAYRMLCSRARVPSDVAEEAMDEKQMQRMVSASGAIGKAPLHICDQGGLSIPQLRAKARRMVQRHGVKLFVVDYLGLINAKGKSLYERVSEVSAGLKQLAKELNVPFIVPCQMNREHDKDSKRKPRLSDLRDSGSVEQDADIVAFIHHTDDGTTLNIEKHRNGRVGLVPLSFQRDITRFESIA